MQRTLWLAHINNDINSFIQHSTKKQHYCIYLYLASPVEPGPVEHLIYDIIPVKYWLDVNNDLFVWCQQLAGRAVAGFKGHNK